MNTNTYNAGVPAKAPISTRIESHIPGTQAHRERKLVEHEQDASMRYGSTNQPSTTSAVAPGMNTAPQTGAYGQGTTIGGTHTHTHGATMSDRTNELHGHGPHTTGGAAKPHMGDKVMGKMEAAVGRATNDPSREQAGWERQTYGDPKHHTALGHNQPMTQPGLGHNQPMQQQPGFAQQGYAPGGQPAQQAFTNPQAGYPAPSHPPTY